MWREGRSVVDEVAREMTAGDAGAGFRAHVMARIDAGERPRRSWSAAWLLSPLAAATVVLLAVALLRGPSARPVSREAQAFRPAGAAHPQGEAKDRPQERLALQPTKQTTAPSGHSPERPALQGLRLTSRRPAQQAPSAIDALAPPPIAVVPMGVERLQAADGIQIQPLDTIAPIAVAPLGVDDIQPDPQRRFP